MYRFFDTNILVYQFDGADPRKQEIARRLWAEAIGERSAGISAQVLVEFANVLRRKVFRKQEASLSDIVRAYARHVKVDTTAGLATEAVLLADRHRLGIFDALILQAAIDAGASTLYSEDLHAGLAVGGVLVVNPFTAAPAASEPAAPYAPARRAKRQVAPAPGRAAAPTRRR